MLTLEVAGNRGARAQQHALPIPALSALQRPSTPCFWPRACATGCGRTAPWRRGSWPASARRSRPSWLLQVPLPLVPVPPCSCVPAAEGVACGQRPANGTLPEINTLSLPVGFRAPVPPQASPSCANWQRSSRGAWRRSRSATTPLVGGRGSAVIGRRCFLGGAYMCSAVYDIHIVQCMPAVTYLVHSRLLTSPHPHLPCRQRGAPSAGRVHAPRRHPAVPAGGLAAWRPCRAGDNRRVLLWLHPSVRRARCKHI